MGQTITVEASVVGEVAVFDTNRSLTGQDGGEYADAEAAAAASGFDAQLARRLFESDPELEHVYVLSNALTVRRKGGWDGGAVAGASDVISTFFVFYPE